MPITSSAKKALRQSVRRQAHNLQYRHALKENLKKVRRFVVQGNAKEAQSALPALYKVLDKSAKEHIIEKNTAARYKSRITKKIAQLSAK